MKTYIALLRGINVGGHKKILMADLRFLLEKSGFQNVKTYIQSGNVICSSSEKEEVVSTIISNAILKKYGWEVPVLVKTTSEINNILTNCPFSVEKKEKSYFIVLDKTPSSELVLETEKISSSKEEFTIINSCIYIHYNLGAGNAKYGVSFFERKLKVKATARNYRTMLKVLEMAT